MRLLVNFLAVFLGLLVGAGSAIAVLSGPRLGGERTADGWDYSSLAGARAADPYTRALVARVGLLALNASETIYFSRDAADGGTRLSPDRCYRITGRDLPARWWSITLYAHDNFLAVNGHDAHSVDATGVRRGPDGTWSALIAPARPPAGDWLSSANAGAFTVTARLYNPEPGAVADRAAIDLPSIAEAPCPAAAGTPPERAP